MVQTGSVSCFARDSYVTDRKEMPDESMTVGPWRIRAMILKPAFTGLLVNLSRFYLKSRHSLPTWKQTLSSEKKGTERNSLCHMNETELEILQ